MQVKLQTVPKKIPALPQKYDNLKRGNNETKYTETFKTPKIYVVFGAESVVFQVAIQKLKDQDI